MFLIVLGIFFFVLATVLARTNPNSAIFGKAGRFAAIGLVALGLLSSCFEQIQPGEVGVQTLFGKVQPGILTEGLNFINPLVDVKRFDIRTQNYTMSGIHDEGQKMGDDAIRVLSADGLQVNIDITVLFRINTEMSLSGPLLAPKFATLRPIMTRYPCIQSNAMNFSNALPKVLKTNSKPVDFC
jgi:regulator of protease activity HflC (stomatin/prohibitin superfamily)